ncbi:MAG TPA: glycosyltransferase family A protein [Polyangiales bacterium]|jgi:glycosyltransferase involved in cell wall biosynthesis|nr:glycosyltransferase family A protein [Polyangiales bacterium]
MTLRASIVITTHNYARYLEGAVQSALAQGHALSELYIVDDGSTDETAEILQRYADRAHIIQQAHAGQCAAYNAGLARVTGDIVLFLDADDLLEARALERILPLFTTGVAKVQFRLRLIDANGRRRGSDIPRWLVDGDLSDLVRAGRLCHSAPGTGNAYRVDTLRRLAPLPECEHDRYGADFFTINGSALLGEVKTCDEVLGAYRVHAYTDHHIGFFGNAASARDERALTHSRHERLRAWIAERLGPQHTIARCQPAFSLEKHVFVRAVLDAPNYAAGVHRGLTHLSTQLWPAISLHTQQTPVRLGLCMWALAVALSPRSISRPLARYGVDPSSR